jgi:hypothetical protein
MGDATPLYATVCVYLPPTNTRCVSYPYTEYIFLFFVLSTARIFSMIGVVHFLRSFLLGITVKRYVDDTVSFLLWISKCCRLFGSWRRPVFFRIVHRVLRRTSFCAFDSHPYGEYNIFEEAPLWFPTLLSSPLPSIYLRVFNHITQIDCLFPDERLWQC